jgi:predicted protein tyrosine phosphatase
MKTNLLFVCSRNQWRSPTAERLFRNHAQYNARSAGTSDKARIRLTQNLICWADIIIVMERKHRSMIREKYAAQLADRPLIVLDIADNYRLNDPELVELIRSRLFSLLGIGE